MVSYSLVQRLFRLCPGGLMRASLYFWGGAVSAVKRVSLLGCLMASVPRQIDIYQGVAEHAAGALAAGSPDCLGFWPCVQSLRSAARSSNRSRLSLARPTHSPFGCGETTLIPGLKWDPTRRQVIFASLPKGPCLPRGAPEERLSQGRPRNSLLSISEAGGISSSDQS